MNEKEFIKFLQEKEWKKFLTRPYNFSFVSIHARAYHNELKHIVGPDCFTFYLSVDGVVKIYRDKGSAEKIRGNFYELISNPLKMSKIIREIIHYRQLLNQIDRIDPREHSKFFTHLTALPFNLGNGIIENRLHENSADYQNILSVLREIRCMDYHHKFGRKYLDKSASDFLYLAIGRRAYFSFNKDVIGFARARLEDDSLRTRRNSVRGSIVFSGMVIGRVRKLFNALQVGEFQAGEVLVSQSTNPELLPAIKMAAAVVTDEGGLMSHAAIICRELKIPCVVGTGCATEVFQDGDLVEVDAVRGIVKKI